MQKLLYAVIGTSFISALAMHSISHDQKSPNPGPTSKEIITTALPIASLALENIYKEGHFALLPLELKRELDLYLCYKIIETILKSPTIYNEALAIIKKVLKDNQLSPIFNSLSFTYFLIHVLHKKERAPRKQEDIAHSLTVTGTKEWLQRHPHELQLLDAVEKNFSTVRALLDQGVNANARDDYGWTPLMWAAKYGHKEIVELLLNKNVDIDAKDNNGYTALMFATMSGHKDVVELLIEAGADVNARDDFGKTALLNPARNGYKDIVEFLLQQGADINAQAEDGKTALKYAIQFGHKDIVNLLLSKRAKQ